MAGRMIHSHALLLPAAGPHAGACRRLEHGVHLLAVHDSLTFASFGLPLPKPLSWRSVGQFSIECSVRSDENGSAPSATTAARGSRFASKEKGTSSAPKSRSKGGKSEKSQKRKVWPKPWAPGWGWDGSADEDMGTLESWLRTEGMPPQKVALNPVQEGERGLVAKQAIGQGETLLYIPEKLLITADTVYGCPRVGARLREAGVPDWPALAVFLLSEASRGGDSEWSPYMEALPQSPSCILMWSLEEVDALLEGSPVRQKALECIAEVTDTFEDLEAVLFSTHRETFPSELFTLGAFKWAFSILFSRLVRLPSQGGRLALVPWGDMLNHKCDVDAFLDFDQLTQAVVVRTDRRYEPGQQVYVSYGPRPNGELLVAYGMVPVGKNPHNAVELQLGLGAEDPLREAKQRALLAHGLTSPQRFPLKMEGLPAQLVAYARLVVAGPATPPETLAEMAAAAGPTSAGLASLLPKWSQERPLEEETGALELLLAACQVALAAYPTSLEEDAAGERQEVPLSAGDEGAFQEKAQAAAALQASERKILYRNDTILRAELRELRSSGGNQEGRTRVKLGNNFGGGGILNAFLKKIASPW